jgi:hypothetical protein
MGGRRVKAAKEDDEWGSYNSPGIVLAVRFDPWKSWPAIIA